MITILPRPVLWLLTGFILIPARAASTDTYPPTTTEGEIRTLVQSLQLARPRLLVRSGEAATAHRGIALLPDGRVLIRDHLTGLKPGVAVRWGMVTSARPREAGAGTLELRQRDATARLHIQQPPGAVWALVDTANFHEKWDSPNPGTVMAAFRVEAPVSGTLDLAVVFSPGSHDRDATTLLPSGSPLDWSSPR